MMIYDNNDPEKEYHLRISRRPGNNNPLSGIGECVNDYIYTCYDTDGIFNESGEKGKVVNVEFGTFN